MDYEKKYKDAIQRAKHALDCDRNNLVSTDVPLIYSMFPELKESEDEEVRKALVDLVKCNERSGYTLLNNVSTSSMLAWLEKQGETYTKRDVDDAWLKGMCDAKRELEKQKDTNIFDVPKISIKDAVEVTSRMQYIEDDIKPIAEFIMDYANWDLHKDEWNQPTLTVPLFRVLDALIQRGKPYCECSQNIEKQDGQNSFWSKEDDVRLQACIDALQAESLMGKVDTVMTKWLESLKQRIGGKL